MKKPFPQSTAQPEPDVVMPAPSFPLHMPEHDDGFVSEEERNDFDPAMAEFLPSPKHLPDFKGWKDSPIVNVPAQIEIIPAAFLYVERKPARIYQFPGRPSPGDLKRIERKQLSVFGLDGGKFVRFLPNGTTEPVSTHEETAAND